MDIRMNAPTAAAAIATLVALTSSTAAAQADAVQADTPQTKAAEAKVEEEKHEGLDARRFYGQAEVHAAVLSDHPTSNLISGGFGYALRAGWRWERFGAFVQGGQGAWFATGLQRDVAPGVLNFGLGGEVRFFDERMRTSLAAGSSTLLFDTALNSAGTTGWFANLRPAGFRWSLSDWVGLEFHPVTFMVAQPVTTRERLTKVEYQTVFALEIK